MCFTKNRCWISEDDGKEPDMIRSGGVFFVAARPSRSSSSEAIALKLNPVTAAAEVEQAALAREHAAFRTPGPAAEATLDANGEPAVRIKVPTGPVTPQLKKERCTKHQVMSLIEAGVNGALRRERTSRI